jgi:polyphosphate kinase
MSSPRTAREIKWDVPTAEQLQDLLAQPLPCSLRSGTAQPGFHRDLYFDSTDGSLTRRGIGCRLRLGADDRRLLTLTLPRAGDGAAPAQRYEAEIAELEPAAAFAGTSDPARRLRGLIDPGQLHVLAELETERTRRLGSQGWPWSARLEFTYDAVSVRHAGLVRGFQELTVRRLRPGMPSLERINDDVVLRHHLRPILEGKLPRAQRLLASLESEALARSLGTSRAVTLLVMESGRVALLEGPAGLHLPSADGRGEAACRHLLRAVFGSAVGDLALLGLAPGRGSLRLQAVWIARRVRRDGSASGGEPVAWLPVEELVSRAGGPGLQNPETLAALALAMRSDLLVEREATALPAPRRSAAPAPAPASPADPASLLQPDLSLIEFHLRVQALAEDPAVPLLERLNYLAIVSANLDEFFMVNVGGLKRGAGGEDPVGWLEAIAVRVRGLVDRQHRSLEECLTLLAGHGVRLRRWSELGPDDRDRLTERFHREIQPLLTPRAITMSPGFPVPVLPHLALCLAVLLHDDRTGPSHLAYLRMPERLPRFLPTGVTGELIAIEELVRANAAAIYPERGVESAHLFRLTRAGDYELDDEGSGDLLQAVEEAVGQRRFNPVARVEVERGMPASLRERLLWELRFERGAEPASLGEIDVYAVDGLLDLRALRELTDLPVPGGKFPPFEGRAPFTPGDLWSQLRAGDTLVHHPYDAFAASVERFFVEAAADPDVVAIRLTLYRAGERSPILDALLRAAQAGKEVSIFVELKARFDEARNIGWVRRLEEAGANVVYGVVGLKNHAKVGLVLRREGGELRRYVHVGTGNYNAATARVYTDLGLFSADAELGADVGDLFNQLTGSSRPPGGRFRRIEVAPESLLPWLLGAIDREIEHARAGRAARIRAKLNGLADTEVVQALYRASQAGVEIDLVVRGQCTLRPGVPGLSERIRVVSLLGRFLEHARIYQFRDGGADRCYIGSADWRPRNLRRRIEVVTPVTDAAARSRLDGLLEMELTDPTAWELASDGRYHRRAAAGSPSSRSTQELLLEKALRVSVGSSSGP